ncbi:MAG TPA: hypothetical protein VHM26_02085 [Chitinophagaceae bacterium]|nr:hypothetical protein [Chitinophagaceae bacterium]
MELSYNNTGTGHHQAPRLAVVRKLESVAVYNEVKKRDKYKKKKNRKKEEKNSDPFKDWCMPEQPTRYLRGSDHDFF